MESGPTLQAVLLWQHAQVTTPYLPNSTATAAAREIARMHAIQRAPADPPAPEKEQHGETQ